MIDNDLSTQPSNIRKEMPPSPAPLWTLLDTYRPDTTENVRNLEAITVRRLEYMASRLRAILMSLSPWKTYNHKWWCDIISYELVIFLIFWIFIWLIILISDDILLSDRTSSPCRHLCACTLLGAVNWPINAYRRWCPEASYLSEYAGVPREQC